MELVLRIDIEEILRGVLAQVNNFLQELVLSISKATAGLVKLYIERV